MRSTSHWLCLLALAWGLCNSALAAGPADQAVPHRAKGPFPQIVLPPEFDQCAPFHFSTSVARVEPVDR